MDKGLDIVALRAVLACHAALGSLALRSGHESCRHDPARLTSAARDAVRAARREPCWDLADRALDWAEGARRHVLAYGDPRYPASLYAITTPPALLFVDGDAAALQPPQLAVVGSRQASRAACDFAATLAEQLAALGATVTSGLARGIDAAAHRGALRGGGTTVAVLGSGIDRIYPGRHVELSAAVRAQGALVSEFALGTPPLPQHFPQRNRLIAGLALGTVVVEAAARSGSLSTAMHALEHGREVFAVPGSIHNPLSRGCHLLLRQGAKLTESIADIVEELPQLATCAADAAVTRDTRAPPTLRLTVEARRVLDACAWAPRSIDELARDSGLTVQQVSSILFALELDGLIEPLASGTYIRAR